VSRVLLVALGGALGSVARYGVGVAAPRVLGTAFPWGTLLVNLLGSFLIALVMHLALTTAAISPSARLFLTTGVMGGFTTYSTFNYETLALVGDRLWGVAALNVGVTVLGCLVAGVLGQGLGRAIAGG
jgi:CrcB protein